jgi:serine/threonine protein kinase
LTDFGLSKYDKDDLKSHCGTPGYMAPEVLAGKRYDNKADIWSLGVVIMKYTDKLPSDQDVSIITAASELPSDEPIFRLLKRMLKAEPSERPLAEECFQDAEKIVAQVEAIKEREMGSRENDSDRRDHSDAVTLTARGKEPLASSKIPTQTLTSREEEPLVSSKIPTQTTLTAREEEPLASFKLSTQTLPFGSGRERPFKQRQPDLPTGLSRDQIQDAEKIVAQVEATKEREMGSRENDSHRRDRIARGGKPLASSQISTQTFPFRPCKRSQPDSPTGPSRDQIKRARGPESNS